MSKEYNKSCNYCKAEIRMSDSSGKWLPYNLDNSIHECRKQNQSTGTQGIKEKERELTLEERVKRLENILKV